MSKYDPLYETLTANNAKHVFMSFAEIEGVLGFALPRSSKQHRAWWSNNPSNNVMTKAWLMAGYKTESVDIAGEKLVFRKTDITSDNGGGLKQPQQQVVESRHPVFGCMAGTVTIAPGVDLTDPADPDWGKNI